MSFLYYSQYLGKQEPLCKWYHLTSYGQGTGELSFVIVNKVYNYTTPQKKARILLQGQHDTGMMNI